MEEIRFGKLKDTLPVPVLVKLQTDSYSNFLQRNISPNRRENVGLEAILRETFPIKTHDGSTMLEYVSYDIGQPRYTADECRQLRLTYGAPLKLRLRLSKTGASGVIEEEVYLGDIPHMIGGGEFIINGAERVIVSQLHRSPGIDFSEERIGDRKMHSCWIVPDRGSWIEISVTRKDTLAIRIDQGGKIPAATFLRATSPEYSTNSDILRVFYETKEVKITSATEQDAIEGRYTVNSIVDPNKNEELIGAGKAIPKGMLKILLEAGVKQVEVITKVDDSLIINSLGEDDAKSHEEALIRIYSRLRPGTPQSLDKAKQLFNERFFDVNRYRLGRIGRFRLNRKFGMNIPETEMVLQKDDIVNSIKYIIKMRKGEGYPDDIDHLGNRRIRTIDELAGDEIRKGFLRLKRSIIERLNFSAQDNVTPKSLVNSKTVSSAIEYFFARGELSQVVDQTNPLAMLAHERRLSALGPGGLNRKRAGFEVRDVHISHYGRICPIETPEGANIGLISSLSLYSSVDEYGFLTTPYYVVKNGRITDEVKYLRADEETDKVMAPADVPMDKSKHILGDKVIVRINGEFQYIEPTKINYADVSPNQLIGVSAALIPFLEHDDANRALMGSNMQRQAVPLVRTEPALVSTGIEKWAAESSAMVVKANHSGTVKNVDAEEIVIISDGEDEVYKLKKFVGLNERTCLNQKPIVKEGDKVKAGDVIADGAATSNGTLALGRNLLVAFMPWDGYNFEDAIIVSERLLKGDVFTSIHIEEFEAEIRETKFGKEEFTRDIPNVSERMLRNLGEDGIINVGTWVTPSDVLVGKVAPKSKSEFTPEEKLLHAIFGRAGEDVKNDSLEVPSGIDGVVIGTKKFSRKSNLSHSEKKATKDEKGHIEREIKKQINGYLENALDELKDTLGRRPVPKNFDYGPRGKAKDLKDLKERLGIEDMEIKGIKQEEKVWHILQDLFAKVEGLENKKEKEINRLSRGEELPTGVLEMVKVYIAVKRTLSVGDKMAGRHGNKGVISKILPEEDMPFLEDGTPVDIILNPLGVPSRMNIGQILETHLGWAAQRLNIQVVTPPFDGATEPEIEELLEKAGLPKDGKVMLYDGRSGESFDEKVTVGVLYMMKLHHLVDDKIHARATGPYSLITQQPLGGKARAGGQRFGEMEVWALEAYGAANILQELLTVKSDDVDGRTKIYESMVKGENVLEPSTPVSFDVLTNEIKGLGLSLKLEKVKQ
ncbi:MAG: DNA-directed RNA polymerase subunit beta [Planctomycetes bacterium RBG_16_43_13]|nr:MAG: DNA-directed RNA polymerase subunit beta [Planctomycetes bacterium RBG_16_43_13]